MVACLLEFVLDNVDSLRGFLSLQLQGFLLLQQVVQFCPINLPFQQILFFSKPLLTGAQLLNGIFLGTNTGLGQFRLSARIRRTGAEVLPVVLPLAHGILGTLELFSGILRFQDQRLLLRLQHIQFFLDARQFLFILFQFPSQFALVGHRLVQFRCRLAAALALVLEALLNAGNVSTGFVVTRLRPIEMFVTLLMPVPQGFQSRFEADPFRQLLLELKLGIPDAGTPGLKIGVQRLPAQHRQFGLFLAFFLLVGLVFFCRLGLTLKVLQLPAKFVPKIRQALQVLLGPADAAFGFLATLFILGDTRSFLDIHPQFFRLGLDKPRDHSLFDNGVAAGTQPGPEEEVGNVTTSAFGAIQEVLRLPLAGHTAAYRNFVETHELAGR